VSIDTCRDLDSSYSFIWSITSLEVDWESDVVLEDPQKTEEGFDDVNSNLSASFIKLKSSYYYTNSQQKRANVL
jgi:hypothetical protein